MANLNLKAGNNITLTKNGEDLEIASQQSEIIVSSTEPTTGEEVWFQKGKNLWNGTIEQGAYYAENGEKVDMLEYCRSAQKIPIKGGETYTFSFVTSTPTDSNYIMFYNNDSFILSVSSLTGTAPSEANYMAFTMGYSNGTYLTPSDISNVQIEQNPTSTSYEAYIDKKIYTKNNNGVYEEFHDETTEDTGWLDLPLGDGISAYDWAIPKYRKIGKLVQVTGVINAGNLASGVSSICSLPYLPRCQLAFVLRTSDGYDSCSLEATTGELISNFDGRRVDIWLTFNYMIAD